MGEIEGVGLSCTFPLLPLPVLLVAKGRLKERGVSTEAKKCKKLPGQALTSKACIAACSTVGPANPSGKLNRLHVSLSALRFTKPSTRARKSDLPAFGLSVKVLEC